MTRNVGFGRQNDDGDEPHRSDRPQAPGPTEERDPPFELGDFLLRPQPTIARRRALGAWLTLWLAVTAFIYSVIRRQLFPDDLSRLLNSPSLLTAWLAMAFVIYLVLLHTLLMNIFGWSIRRKR